MMKNLFINGNINEIVKEYMPFTIKTISNVTGRYVSIENDEELSIGLMALVEAIEKYDESKGPFLAFAKLVITSRIRSYMLKESKKDSVSIDQLEEAGIQIGDILDSPTEDSDYLKEEINKLKEEISMFGIELEDLARESPKHRDTRENAIEISKKVNEDKPIVNLLYEKKRLPIKKISVKYSITEKIIKGSKKFITTVVIILHRDFRNLKLWILK